MFKCKLFSKNHNYRAYVFTLLLAFLCLYSTQSFSAEFPDCYPAQVNGVNTKKCPPKNVTRDEINVKCVQEQTKNQCIDIMPVKNVSRIAENLCWRDWSDGRRPHNGMDYPAGTNESITAAADGVVEVALSTNIGSACGSGANGQYVKIRHSIGNSDKNELAQPNKNAQGDKNTPIVESPAKKCFYSSYLHLSKVSVSAKKSITKGTHIGNPGGTSCSGGALKNHYSVHLHFQMSDCVGAPIDPMCPDIMGLCSEKISDKSVSAEYVGKKTNYSGEGSFDPLKKCTNCDLSYANCDGLAANSGDQSKIPGGGSYKSGISGITSNESGFTKCSIQDYRESFKECIFCNMFRIVFNTASETSAIALKALQTPVINLVLLGFALWLAYTIVKHVSTMSQTDPRRMIKEILTQAAIVLFIIVLLMFGSTGVFSWFIEPVFNTGMKFAMLVANASSGETTVGGKIVMKTCPVFADVSEVVGGIPASMGQNILCVIKSVQDMIMDIISLGSTMFCLGMVEKAVIPYIFPHFGYALTGAALYIMAVLVLIIYPWLLIDAILRMSVTVAIFPAALGAGAFKTTRKYIGMIFGTFLTSMFNFIFLTIIIFLLMELVYKTVGSTVMETIKSANDNSALGEILENVGWWTVGFLKLAFILILTYAMMGGFEGLASSFGGITGSALNLGSGGSGIGTNIGTTAYSLAKEASKTPRQMASKGIKNAAGTASRHTKSAIHSMRTDMKAKSIEKGGVKNADGSFTKTKTSLFGKVTTETVKIGANGKPLITTTVDNGKKTTTTQTDGFMKKTSVVDNKTGAQISEEFEMKDAALRKLMNKKGEVDMVSVQNLLQNSGHSQEDCLKGVMTQVLKEKYGENNKMMDPKGTDQKIEIGQDEKGQMTFSMSQKNSKGEDQNFNMTLGEKRIRTEVETIDKKGRSQALISDGIFNMTSNRKYNEDRSDFKSQNSFSINSYYDGAYRQPIKGKKIDKKVYGETMLTDKELRGAIHQKRKYGNLSS